MVTPTRRLSRELIARYDQHQISRQLTAWQSADVLPWDAWIDRCWDISKARIGKTPLTLTEQQLLAVWRDIVAADIAQNEADSEPLWHTRSSALAGIQALKLLREWELDIAEIADSPHRDHRCFGRWFNQFDQLCQSRNWIDRYQIATLLNASMIDISSVALVGFDRLLPQQARWIQALSEDGVRVFESNVSADFTASMQVIEFETENDHWLGAADWARQRLKQNPDAKLAIVSANPGKSRELIEYCLKQILCPEQILQPTQSSPLPFHLSLGKPLSLYPPVRDALILLKSVCRFRLDPETFCRFVRSDYMAGAKSERIPRAELEIWIRKNLPQESDFRFLRKALDTRAEQYADDACALLRRVLFSSEARLEETPSNDLYANWALLFDEILELLGWPGQGSIDTVEFQAIDAFRQQLRRLGELDLAQSKVKVSVALGALQQLLDQQIFQIEGNEAPIQVMGVLETSGLYFDHIWFGSLTASEWPSATRPNPFIPIHLQRNAGIEYSSVENNLKYTRLQQQRLSESCHSLTLGVHKMDGDVSVEPSPLLLEKSIALIKNPVVPDSIAKLYHDHRPELERWPDNVGDSVKDVSIIRGGTSLVQMQSACPRGAYAAYRLRAREIEDNEPGLDAAERGSLVHRALELAWNHIQSSSHLRQMPQAEFQEIISRSVSSASARFRSRSSCGDGYFVRLHGWLTATLEEWFALEAQRSAEFTVLAVEEKTHLQLGELPLNFKIDRIDRLASGELVLIDYKTGSQNSIYDWADERVSAPQLPLYSLSQIQLGHDIQAIAFAEVKLGACAFIGMSEQEGFGLPEAKSIRVKSFDKTKPFLDSFESWDQCLTHWRYALENLAEEFMFGDARVAPGNGGICDHCPSPAICRSGNQTAREEQ